MKQISPAERDRAQRRVRSITMASAAGAGVLTLVGAAVTAGTFAGRTVSTTSSTQATTPTLDPSSGLQQPIQPPGDGSSFGNPNAGQGNAAPIVSGSS